MSKEEKIEIVTHYIGVKLVAQTLVENGYITDKKAEEMRGKTYDWEYDD